MNLDGVHYADCTRLQDGEWIPARGCQHREGRRNVRHTIHGTASRLTGEFTAGVERWRALGELETARLGEREAPSTALISPLPLHERVRQMDLPYRLGFDSFHVGRLPPALSGTIPNVSQEVLVFLSHPSLSPPRQKIRRLLYL
jgi:hypothetical protein